MGLTAGAKAILWLDLETTGSDVDLDGIIEVGAVLTDFEFERFGEPFNSVCRPGALAYDRLMQNDVVRKMHTSNGLLKDIEALNDDVTIKVIDVRLVHWLRSHLPEGRVILAGSGVSHFDRKFIDAYMPTVSEQLTYPTLDVGVVRRFLRFAGVLPKRETTKSHRALDDIQAHLEEARSFKELLQGLYY